MVTRDDRRLLIRCLDFEYTGLSTETEKHALCEVGYCDVICRPADRPEVGQPWSMLVNPGRPMSPEARAVHHISDDMVKDAPPPVAAFKRLMEGPPDFFAAHQADGDKEYFGGGEVPWFCSWKATCRYVPEAPAHKLQVLRYHLDLPCDPAIGLPAHRAGPDAYVLAHLVARMIENGGVVDDMVRWSKGAALLPRLMVGQKHRGWLWKDVPEDYLIWLADKSEFDRDLKANARYHLKQREIARAAERAAKRTEAAVASATATEPAPAPGT